MESISFRAKVRKMPELPEVQTITSDLKKYFENSTIDDVKISGEYNVYPDRKFFLAHTKNVQISSINRIAKNIVFELENGYFMVFHLAMTGRLLIRALNQKPDKWTKITFTLKKNNKSVEVRFCDMRMFGKAVLYSKEELEKMKQKYGPEAHKGSIDAKEFAHRLNSKRTTIKNALLDQSIISGLGNIYATDSLFLARIHPETKTQNIDTKSAAKLLEAAKLILNEGIEHRGSTLEDAMYVDAFGKPGTHQNYFRIYGKKTCINCSGKVSVKKINGRGTYFCSFCQILLEGTKKPPVL
ncbi:DNA-formamidopyrimidine glycosylase [candidate division WWE3 bacterium RIFCSPHIGHO2_12_FULL_38_15]|uniref:DNA-(apurinic or apyrimidinic site) lyase n=1 Tax=candidate division WWE3 bacterium RIFCSPHIGHO2_02_FULL_38_14 TaxID=1802620 RepID=A0A1F4V711_UNCKA|nr:MAG: DNA-formamidopyrimidine glycosylase [candidate division WWE3 bacterium RIFCSPHIGHO2_01_FULL_38_45]OGC48732.1 MAG: DNA-formamidopyrimidine glycosylase [candidate division WWE3 bacterium RIFCSPHIGHO2_12_FULL_38_15]OGC52657.1 MAG: DNA-formamidopyrimidine glycosylase [candidate division WWE3 bacterium RIFCSPLOWO2_01_FULL_37_24]OGC52931.1 MAG: DNA-formamidopyrimidine glycosylase [candidate division WWE3 bacterium RIFCSPHIGHO2_02_FULL_38_14]